jgi:hypothetical protein
VPKYVLVEDKIPDWGNDNGTRKTIETELPGLFSLTCTCIHAGHEKDDVE